MTRLAGVVECNTGYKLCEWYLPQRFSSFKEEILKNPKSGLSASDWTETMRKAATKYKAYKTDADSRPMMCKWPFWQRLYGIKKGAEVTVQHLMSLLFYTNFSRASYEFSASFRRIVWNETDASLKRRHSFFAIQGRLLRELVECFGTTMSKCPGVKVFYHGIASDMVFESTSFCVHGPMSTTDGLFAL